MALSKNFWKIFSFFFPFADFFYILQQEEYSSRRLIKWLPRFFLRRNFQIRQHLALTKRVKITLALTMILWIGSLAAWLRLVASLGTIVQAATIVVWLLAIPLFVLLGNFLLTGYFEKIKRSIRASATIKVRQHSNLKIVTIAGSYGKTTVKNFIFQLVKYNYRTQMIPGNINTPAGIANWVNNNLEAGTELLIAEVDAYEIGEIAKSCDVIPADIAVLTNIGDQHLERFGSKQNLALALSETFTHAKPGAQVIALDQTFAELKVLGIKLENQTAHQPDNTSAAHLAKLSDSNMINLGFALTVAKLLNIPEKFIQDTVPNLELPDRRQKVAEMYGYQAVDDSYNISFTTAQAGISAARSEADKQNKKLLVLCAGIPELASENQAANFELGKILGQKADHVIVLGSMFASDIVRGIEASTDKSKYTLVPDLQVFLKETKLQFPAGEWFLLMQPELGDLYY